MLLPLFWHFQRVLPPGNHKVLHLFWRSPHMLPPGYHKVLHLFWYPMSGLCSPSQSAACFFTIFASCLSNSAQGAAGNLLSLVPPILDLWGIAAETFALSFRTSAVSGNSAQTFVTSGFSLDLSI